MRIGSAVGWEKPVPSSPYADTVSDRKGVGESERDSSVAGVHRNTEIKFLTIKTN